MPACGRAKRRSSQGPSERRQAARRHRRASARASYLSSGAARCPAAGCRRGRSMAQRDRAQIRRGPFLRRSVGRRGRHCRGMQRSLFRQTAPFRDPHFLANSGWGREFRWDGLDGKMLLKTTLPAQQRRSIRRLRVDLQSKASRWRAVRHVLSAGDHHQWAVRRARWTCT